MSRPSVLRPPRLRYGRSEEHTSELQSRSDLVCRLLLEKKKKKSHNRRSLSTNNKRRARSTSRTPRSQHPRAHQSRMELEIHMRGSTRLHVTRACPDSDP